MLVPASKGQRPGAGSQDGFFTGLLAFVIVLAIGVGLAWAVRRLIG